MRKHALVTILLSMLIIMSLFGIFLVNGLFAESADNSENGSARASARLVSYDVDTTIASVTPYTDEVIYLNGNLTIGNGGVLELVNTTLRVNQTGSSGFVFSITVESGGILRVTNESLIRTNSDQSDYELHFMPGSEGYFKDSTVSDCGFISEEGLFIETNDVIFINCTLEDNYFGINCNAASPTIIDSIFTKSELSAIRGNNSAVTLENCIIENSDNFDVIAENDSVVTLLSTAILNYEWITIKDTSELHVTWWLTVNVMNQTGSMQNAFVNVTDLYGNQIFFGETDTTGIIKDIECTEFIENSTDRNLSTPHTILVTRKGYKDVVQNVGIHDDEIIGIILEELPTTGTIRGSVKDSAGNPIENVNVSVEVDGKIIWTTTDLNGLYLIEEITPGQNYTVSAEGKINNLSAYEIGIKENVVVVPDGVTTVDFVLEKRPLPVTVEVQSWEIWISADNANDVNIDTGIKITFDEPMDNSTINTNNIQLKAGGNDIPGIIIPLNENINTEFLFSSDENLAKKTTYTFIITSDVRKTGLDGEVFWEDYVISFETEIDPILDFGPADKSTEIDFREPEIYIIFENSIELNLTSLQKEFGVYLGTNIVEGSVEIVNPIEKRVEFQLGTEVELEPLTTYTVGISDNVRDTSNQRFVRPPGLTWTFTTRQPDIITGDIFGTILDKSTGEPILNATVRLFNPENNLVGSEVTDIGGFFIFIDYEVMKYTIEISVEGYKGKEISAEILSDGQPVNLGEIDLVAEKAEEDDKGAEGAIDPMLLGIIGVIILIIIIIIILAVVLRRPKEVVFEEEEEERVPEYGAREAPQLPSTVTAAPTPPPQPTYYEPMEGEEEAPVVKLTMERCPMCGHRISTLGECFRCYQAQKYGL